MHDLHWSLLAALTDGTPQHIFGLAKTLEMRPQQLNGIWQRMPPHLRGLLRQHDGYWRLVRPLAVFNRQSLADLPDMVKLHLVNECTSSNDVVLVQARQDIAAAHGLLCVTHHQTHGRGRQGKSWVSRIGECVMFSLGWVFERPQAELGALAPVAALACRRVLAACGADIQIKWPNDLVVGGKKLGGILIETVRSGGQTAAVIGIGINFVQPKEVEQATSVQTESTVPVVAAELLTRLVGELTAMLPEFDRHGFAPFMADYQAAHRDQNREVMILQHGKTMFEGTVLGVTEQGALRLQTEQGERVVVSGELNLRRHEDFLSGNVSDSRRYLLLDAGNSRLKWAWVENNVLSAVSAAHYCDLSALGEDWKQHGTPHTDIIGCAVCGEEKKTLIADQLTLPVCWKPSTAQNMGIRNHYRNPAEHGADRWFNVLGARRFTRNACVVVSCGTAVTVDVLTDDNHYLGGTILPGFHLMKEALAQNTANLNCSSGKVYPFPTTTANAVASGMMDAVCGAVVLMHSRLKNRIPPGGSVDVILTGGGAVRIAQALSETFTLDNYVRIVDNLAVYGLFNSIRR